MEGMKKLFSKCDKGKKKNVLTIWLHHKCGTELRHSKSKLFFSLSSTDEFEKESIKNHVIQYGIGV